jgi:hypothetical protein
MVFTTYKRQYIFLEVKNKFNINLPFKLCWKERLVAGFPLRRPRFEARLGHVRFVLDNVALGQVFSEYFGFPCQFSFHRLLHIHHLSSGAGIIGQLVADVWSGLSLTPLQEPPPPKKKAERKFYCVRSDSNTYQIWFMIQVLTQLTITCL